MDAEIACPHCQQVERQVKAGSNGGNQRYKCMFCNRRYTPVPQQRGYADHLHSEARRMSAQGLSTRAIGHQLGIAARTVANWLQSDPVDAVDAIEGESALPESLSPRRRPTILDVADHAGVSTSTVSNYLNRTGRMGKDTRKRIQTSIQALNFTPNYFIKAIRQRRTRVLGLLTFGMGDVDSPFSVTAQLLAGLNEAASVAEYEILLYTNWWQPERHYSGLSFLNGQVDGLIWVAPHLHEPLLERVAAGGLATIALMARIVPNGVGFVCADNADGTRQIVSHLVSLGHRRIAYLGPNYTSDFRDRRTAFRQAIAEAGISRECQDICPRLDTPEIEQYDRIMDAWFARIDAPTAIIASTDATALQIGESLVRRGLRIPEDIALAGFNDVFEAKSQFGGLTSVRQPFRKMAQTAGERLIALIDGAPVEECRIILPAELIVRASSQGSVQKTRQ